MFRFVFLRPSLCLAFPLCVTLALHTQPQSEPCSAAATTDHAQNRVSLSLSSPKYITVDEITFAGQPELTSGDLNATAKQLVERKYEDNPHWLDEFRERVRDAWQQRGYFRVQLPSTKVVEHTADQTGRHLALTITVDAGRQYYLSEIDFLSATVFSSAELRAMFPIQDGAIFDTHKLQKGVENLRKAYGTKGYMNFSMVPSFDLSDDGVLIKTNIEIDEGKAYTIGEVKILGLAPGVAQSLLQESGLVRGNIFNALLFDNFFERNRSVFPQDAAPEEDTQRSLDEQRATVDITMDFRRCPTVAQH